MFGSSKRMEPIFLYVDECMTVCMCCCVHAFVCIYVHVRAETNSSNIPKLQSWSNLRILSIDSKVRILSYAPAKAIFVENVAF